jgi:hypothetical protein
LNLHGKLNKYPVKPEFVLINNAGVIQIGSHSNQAVMKNFTLWAADILPIPSIV